MGTRLKDKVAVVTGSGQGIGKAIALGLAEEGAKLVVNNRSPDTAAGTAADVAKEIKDAGGEAAAVFADVGTMEGGQKVIQTAIDNFGRIDILINNAGISRRGMVWEMTEKDWDAVIAVHLKGHFTCTKFASILMREQRSGRIINTSSRSGLYGRVGGTNYSAAKAGIVALTRCVARDLGPYGITVNCVCPSADTRMGALRQRLATGEGPPRPAYVVARDKQIRDPKDVAPLVVWLASDEAAQISDQIFYVGAGEIELITHPVSTKSVLHKAGRWTVDEISAVWPSTLGLDLMNPAPPVQSS